MPEAKTEVGDLDWRLPYRSMDAGGTTADNSLDMMAAIAARKAAA